MKIHNVYINGTNQSNELEGLTSLANVLYAMTIEDENQSSRCIEGCGIHNPDPRDLNGIFTFHLEAQINELISEICSKPQMKN